MWRVNGVPLDMGRMDKDTEYLELVNCGLRGTAILGEFPKLRKVYIHNQEDLHYVRVDPKWEELTISCRDIWLYAGGPELNLRKITFHGFGLYTEILNPLTAVLEKCPKLEDVDIGSFFQFTRFTVSVFVRLLRTISGVRHLCVRGVPKTMVREFAEELGKFPNLEYRTMVLRTSMR